MAIPRPVKPWLYGLFTKRALGAQTSARFFCAGGTRTWLTSWCRYQLAKSFERLEVQMNTNDIRMLTEQQAAEYIGMSRSFLRKSRMDGNRANRTPGPPFIRVTARAIRYDIRALDAWIEANRCEIKSVDAL